MSRRTKLLVLAVFLVLLVVPVLYLALAWHPPNPLRFRIVHFYPQDVSVGGNRRLRIRIENTSFVPIEFSGAAIDPRPGLLTGGSGNIDPQWQFDGKRVHIMSPPTILPSDAVELSAWLKGELASEAEQGSLRVEYAWSSQLMLKWNGLRDWIQPYIPFFLKDRRKYGPPYGEDVTTLEGTKR